MAGSKSELREIIESIVIAVILALVIRAFVVEAFYIPSGSMEPTLQVGDRILVNKFIYRFRDIQHQDLVVFKYPLDPDRDFIKRVIGIGGDNIQIEDGMVLVNEEPLDENYLENRAYNDYGPVAVPEDHFFVLGDNRNNSEDSRYWGFVPRKNMVGEAFVIYWPLDRIQLLE